MIIVLEGPDGAGKTFLADAVEKEARDRGIETIRTHEGKPPTGVNLYDYYARSLRLDPNTLQIADRHHCGHLIYGSTRHRLGMSWRDMEDINERIFDTGGKILFLVPPMHVLLDRLNERGETWPRLRDEADRFEFMGQLLQEDWPRHVRLIDRVISSETQSVVHWLLGNFGK